LNEQLKRLIALQEVDSKIFSVTRVIDSFPSKINEIELPFRESQDAFALIKQEVESLERKKRDKESALDDLDDKIKKLKSRTADIKTNKEYQALLGEIASVEKERFSLEDAILVIMEEMESALKQTQREEAKYKMNKEKIDILRKNIEQEKLDSEKTLQDLNETRAGIAATIDKEIYDQYADLIDIHTVNLVVEAKGEICQGCNMNIPPQLFVELKKNEDIVHCPQCRRIIYFKNTTDTATQ
jgi:uncharacterized protein